MLKDGFPFVELPQIAEYYQVYLQLVYFHLNSQEQIQLLYLKTHWMVAQTAKADLSPVGTGWMDAKKKRSNFITAAV